MDSTAASAPQGFTRFESLHRCTVCGGGQLTSLFPPDIARCGECGAVVRQVRPTRENLVAAREAALNPERTLGTKAREALEKELRERMRAVTQQAGPQQVAGRSLLDICAGTGDFLETARAAGWVVAGTEMSETLAQAARRRGFEMYAGAMHELPLEGRTFDVITLWDSLDYLRNPADALRQLSRMLKPGGVLFLSVANFDETLFHHRFAASAAGNPLGELAPGESARLNFFASATFREAMIRNGWKIHSLTGELRPTVVPAPTDSVPALKWWAAPLKSFLLATNRLNRAPALRCIAEVDKNPVRKPADFE